MTFPVEYHLFGTVIPAHAVFETLSYIAGVQTYVFLRHRDRHELAPPAQVSMWLVVCCVFGALVGSKLLAWLESPGEYLQAAKLDPRAALGGKTIVGGLLGGWAGVELGKKWFGVQRRTGDGYVLPLVLGIAIGRIGCFLTGLPDHTYGIATSLPWGVDFGDGIGRHPTQIYEILFVLLLGGFIWLRARRPYEPGDLFRLFMLGYFGFRFCVEFIKPRYTGYGGLSAIQWASAAGMSFALIQLRKKRSDTEVSARYV